MKLFPPFLCESPPHSSLQQHVGDCQVPLASLPGHSRAGRRWALKAGAALGSRARGEGFSWDFCPHWSLTRGEENQQEVPTELFFLLTFVSRETREEKGQELVQLQSLAVAQAKSCWLWTKICLCSNPWWLYSLLSTFPGGEAGARRMDTEGRPGI